MNECLLFIWPPCIPLFPGTHACSTPPPPSPTPLPPTPTPPLPPTHPLQEAMDQRLKISATVGAGVEAVRESSVAKNVAALATRAGACVSVCMCVCVCV